MLSQKLIVRTSTMRMTWFMRRLPSNAFSGVNSNTRHWSASQKPLRFIKKKHERRKTLEKEMAIRDVKMMITIEDLLIVSPLEYIHFNSSIHLLPVFIEMNTFLDKQKIFIAKRVPLPKKITPQKLHI